MYFILSDFTSKSIMTFSALRYCDLSIMKVKQRLKQHPESSRMVGDNTRVSYPKNLFQNATHFQI